MKNLKFLLIILIVLSIGCNRVNKKTIKVKINKNIETLFILYPLADVGIPPANNSLCKIASNEFKDYKNHEVVRLLDTLISRTGIDGPVSLILHYSELPNIK